MRPSLVHNEFEIRYGTLNHKNRLSASAAGIGAGTADNAEGRLKKESRSSSRSAQLTVNSVGVYDGKSCFYTDEAGGEKQRYPPIAPTKIGSPYFLFGLCRTGFPSTLSIGSLT
jgi:hypothetical protein